MDNFNLKKYLSESKLLKEETIFANFRSGVGEGSLKEKFARTMSETLHLWDYWNLGERSIKISELFDEGEMESIRGGDPEGFYAGEEESLRVFKSLPSEFYVSNNIEGEETFKIIKTGEDSFTVSAENNLTENKGLDLAKDVVSKAREAMKKLTDEEVEAFKKEIANAFDLK
tara:strand:+ start:101 stop:616 length:516 start_codon:yes stop_codon:yes gene_type:complete